METSTILGMISYNISGTSILHEEEFIMYSQMSPPNSRSENLWKLLVCFCGFSLNNSVAAAVITTDPCSHLSLVWKRKSRNVMYKGP